MLAAPPRWRRAGPTFVLGPLRVTFAPVVLPEPPAIGSERGDLS
ncbi:hypothetical protein [Sorangium cellulosum]|nr:hypothetical protein [Sorangium cellulosum]